MDTYRGDSTLPLTLNLYIYCGGNPINFTDPTGHSFIRKIAKRFTKKVKKAYRAAKKTVKKAAKKAVRKAKKTAKNAGKRLRSAGKKLSKSIKKAKKKAKKRKDEFLGAVGSVWSKAKKSIAKIGKKIKTSFTDGTERLLDSIKDKKRGKIFSPSGRSVHYAINMIDKPLAAHDLIMGVVDSYNQGKGFKGIVDDFVVNATFVVAGLVIGTVVTTLATSIIGSVAVGAFVGLIVSSAVSYATERFGVKKRYRKGVKYISNELL